MVTTVGFIVYWYLFTGTFIAGANLRDISDEAEVRERGFLYVLGNLLFVLLAWPGVFVYVIYSERGK